MYDANNKEIQWQLIVNLYHYQNSCGLTFANKLSKQHVLFEKNKMKVKYAVQVLSQSVANALLTLSDLKHPDFINVHPTVEFLKTFDVIFDIMNSRSVSQQFSKAPLQPSNENRWKEIFNNTVQYITNLKTSSGQCVLDSTR